LPLELRPVRCYGFTNHRAGFLAHRSTLPGGGTDMKRIGLLLLAVVMMVGMAGCKKSKHDDIDVTGTWSVWVNWTSTSTGTFSVVIYPDGTVITGPSRHVGTWVLDGDKITINLESGLAVYVGTTNSDGDSMSGTMTNNSGSSGVWNASLASRETPARSVSQDESASVKDLATGL
jgi:hypothetical protein